MVPIKNLIDSAENIDTEVLFSISNGVQLVVIRGEITEAPTPCSSLEIFKVLPKDDVSRKGQDKLLQEPNIFINVGSWVYPLTPKQTPVLQNEHGIFVVSNPVPEDPTMCVGIILPRDQPELENHFVEVLNNYAIVKTSNIATAELSQEQARLSKKIAAFSMKNAFKLSSKIERGATKANDYLVRRGENYRNKTQPKEEPTTVNPIVQKGAIYFHEGSKKVSTKINYVLEKIGQFSGEIGTKVGSKLNKVADGEGEARRALRGTLTLAGGGVVSMGVVFISLEKASKTLFKSFANETVENTRHKYGDEAAETKRLAISGAAHTANAGWGIINFVDPRMLGQRVVMQAGAECAVEGGGYGKPQPEANKQENDEEKQEKI